MIRLLCVEDNPLMRGYLAMRLAVEPDIQMVSAVTSVSSALIHLRHTEIDVVLLDYQLGKEDGLQLLQGMTAGYGWLGESRLRPAVLFCTGYADDTFEAKAQAMGASGVVAKERIATELIPALHAVAGGGTWYHGAASGVRRETG